MGMGGGVSTAVKVDSVVVHPRANAFFVSATGRGGAFRLSRCSPTTSPPTRPATYGTSGDGTTYTDVQPGALLYQAAGTYDVVLIANNEWNCPDTFLLQSATAAIASGDIRFPNAFTPGSAGPTGGSLRSTLDMIMMCSSRIHEGVEEYRLEIFNRWGELLFVSEDVALAGMVGTAAALQSRMSTSGNVSPLSAMVVRPC
jgi:hypothetical protein